MSTNSECLFQEVEPGKWYYVLENCSAPKNAWDWREYAACYGPFGAFEAANEHLSRCHANPGGYSKQGFEPGYQPDKVMQKLIGAARV